MKEFEKIKNKTEEFINSTIQHLVMINQNKLNENEYSKNYEENFDLFKKNMKEIQDITE